MTLDSRLDRLREAVEAIGLEMGLRSLKDRGAREEALRLIEELRAEMNEVTPWADAVIKLTDVLRSTQELAKQLQVENVTLRSSRCTKD